MLFSVRRTGLMALLIIGFATALPASAQSPQYDLLKAVDKADLVELNELLRKGVSPDTRTRSDRVPAILIAAHAGNAGVVKLLLDHDANPNISDNRGQTPLMARSIVGDTAMITMLLSYGADPNRADIAQETALMKAVRGRKFKAAQALIEAGADPNVQDLTGKTALEYAKISRSRRFIRLLQDAGATY